MQAANYDVATCILVIRPYSLCTSNRLCSLYDYFLRLIKRMSSCVACLFGSMRNADGEVILNGMIEAIGVGSGSHFSQCERS